MVLFRLFQLLFDKRVIVINKVKEWFRTKRTFQNCPFRYLYTKRLTLIV